MCVDNQEISLEKRRLIWYKEGESSLQPLRCLYRFLESVEGFKIISDGGPLS